MQERRTTVRVPHRARARYCPSEAFPLDGHLMNISERGAALLTREARPSGERLAMDAALPGEPGSVTATGVVRWSEPAQDPGWHVTGLEWLALDEAVQQRLRRFLQKAGKRAGWRWHLPAKRLALGAGVAGAAAGAVFLILWARALRRQEQQLQRAVQQQSVVIDHLEAERGALQTQLSDAATSVMETAQAVTALGDQAQAFEQTVQQLQSGMLEARRSYDQVKSERDDVFRQAASMRRQAAAPDRRFIRLEELQRAIREMIERRQLDALSGPEITAAITGGGAGNEGYVVRGGHSTLPSVPARVRVYDPQPAPAE